MTLDGLESFQHISTQRITLDLWSYGVGLGSKPIPFSIGRGEIAHTEIRCSTRSFSRTLKPPISIVEVTLCRFGKDQDPTCICHCYFVAEPCCEVRDDRMSPQLMLSTTNVVASALYAPNLRVAHFYLQSKHLCGECSVYLKNFMIPLSVNVERGTVRVVVP